jgi:hypothetical protein
MTRAWTGHSGPGAHAAPGPIPVAGSAYFEAAAFAFASLQSDFDMDTQPWPLQLFMPLQLFFADLHSDVPLQELTPVQ